MVDGDAGCRPRSGLLLRAAYSTIKIAERPPRPGASSFLQDLSTRGECDLT